MKKVRVTKISASTEPLYPMQALNEHMHGQVNSGFTLPVEYYVEGVMDKAPIVGESFHMLRHSRNNIQSQGVFITSKVIKVNEDGFETLNSIYRLDYL